MREQPRPVPHCPVRPRTPTNTASIFHSTGAPSAGPASTSIADIDTNPSTFLTWINTVTLICADCFFRRSFQIGERTTFGSRYVKASEQGGVARYATLFPFLLGLVIAPSTTGFDGMLDTLTSQQKQPHGRGGNDVRIYSQALRLRHRTCVILHKSLRVGWRRRRSVVNEFQTKPGQTFAQSPAQVVAGENWGVERRCFA
jgi:hypothetical protein